MNQPAPGNSFVPPPNSKQIEMAKIQLLDAIAQGINVIAVNTGPNVGHVAVIAQLKDGAWGVFCHACSAKHQTYVFPCAQDGGTPEGVFPPTNRLVVEEKAGEEQAALNERLQHALQMVRSLTMDQPSDSHTATRLREIIGVLTPS